MLLRICWLKMIVLIIVLTGCIKQPLTISSERWWPPVGDFSDSLLLNRTVNLQGCVEKDMSLTKIDLKLPIYRAGAWIHPRSLRTKSWSYVLSGSEEEEYQEKSSIALSIVPYIIDRYGVKRIVAPYFMPKKPSYIDEYKPSETYYVVCQEAARKDFLSYPHYYPTMLLTTLPKQQPQLHEKLKNAITGDKWIELTNQPISLTGIEKIQLDRLLKKILSESNNNVQLPQILEIPFDFEVEILEVDDKPFGQNFRDKRPPTIKITSPITRGVSHIQTEQVTIRGIVTDDSGVAKVQVQGQSVSLDKSGYFKKAIFLQTGKNTVRVTAEDIYHNRAEKTFTLVQKAISSVPPNVQPGDYYALLIGNKKYRYLTPLRTTIDDVTVIANLLRTQYGFNTKLLLNANRSQILDAFNQLQKTIEPEDNLIIYYAGHGHYDKQAEKAYWLSVDAQKNSTTQWIIADTITSEIKRLPARHILIVADSCYSGTLTHTRKISPDLQQRARFLTKMLTKPSRTLMASGGNEPVLDGGGSGHSVFANAFITALRDTEKPLFTAEELFHTYIREMVAGTAEQLPEYNIIRNSGHNGGDFVFKKLR